MIREDTKARERQPQLHLDDLPPGVVRGATLVRERQVWWHPGGRRIYHPVPVPPRPEYALMEPGRAYGTVAEAREAGYGERCTAGRCGRG